METSKIVLKKGSEEERLEQYSKKEVQSEIYKKKIQKMQYMAGAEFNTKKNSIMSMIKQMIETRAWKKSQGIY